MGTGSTSGVFARICLLADDLTSAGDGAAPFLAAGHPARILLSAAPGSVYPGVTAVDLDSRRMPEDEARGLTSRAARDLADSHVLVKTVDSTLRGHLAAEIGAALSGSGRASAVIAPAFPAEGRITQRGVQLVHGLPVADSDFARDSAHPVRDSDLMALLPGALLVEPEDVARLPALIGSAPLLVCSASTDQDLDRIVTAVPRPGDVLWVGSPGLAAALARHGAVGPDAAVAGVPHVVRARRPLVVVGSANPTARRQLARLAAQPGVDTVTVTDDVAGTITMLRAAQGPVLTVHTPPAGRPAGDVNWCQRLAEVARALVADGAVDALVLTGGQTARAVLSALGATGVDLLDEPEPGVARGLLRGGPGCVALMKAGGFGDDDALVRLCRAVTSHPCDHGGRP